MTIQANGFVDEMRMVSMRLHTREQAREGEKEVKDPEERSVSKWDPTIDGHLRFLVESKLVYDALEGIVEKLDFPVAEKLLNNKDMECYKWDGELKQILQNPRDKINKITLGWTREEKNQCLEETERSFKFSGDILRLILSPV